MYIHYFAYFMTFIYFLHVYRVHFIRAIKLRQRYNTGFRMFLTFDFNEYFPSMHLANVHMYAVRSHLHISTYASQ